MTIRYSGVGSWPGTDMAATIRMTLGELPETAYLPELPARGPGADMIGRTCAVLEEFDVDLQPTGWRLAEGSSLIQAKAAQLLRDDLDMCKEFAQGFEGPIRITLAGPLTLAASVELPRGGRVLGDHGAMRDLRDGLAEAAVRQIAETARRIEGPVSLQLDEPMLGSLIRGEVPTVSGLYKHRPIPAGDVVDWLAPLIDRIRSEHGQDQQIVVHSCGSGLPIHALGKAGVNGVGLDIDQLTSRDLDAVAQLLDEGGLLHLGVAPTTEPDVLPGPDALAKRALGLLQPLEMGPAISDQVVLTPACGLAGWSPKAALAVLRQLGSAAGIVEEELAR